MTYDLCFPRQCPHKSASIRCGIFSTGLDFDLPSIMSGSCLIHEPDQLLDKLVDNFVIIVGQLHAIIKQNVSLPLIVIWINNLKD